MENKINPIEGQLTIIDAEGNERLCQILFTLESEEFGKKYVVFYPIEQLEGEDDEQIQLMAASYTEGEDGNGELQEIETEEEWALIEDAVAEFEESMAEEHHCGCGCGHECGEGECECDGECEESEEEHHCGCGHCHHHEE
jgi:uncharacterized protein YrzB (UPF0473 family)